MDTKQRTTKHRTIADSHNGSNNKQKVNNNRTTALERTGTLNAFYWYQIFALDSAVVEIQEMFSSHGGILTIAMYHHGEKTLIKLTHYNETKKMAHDSQIVRAKENLNHTLRRAMNVHAQTL